MRIVAFKDLAVKLLDWRPWNERGEVRVQATIYLTTDSSGEARHILACLTVPADGA
jgi:hypothetical protein